MKKNSVDRCLYNYDANVLLFIYAVTLFNNYK